MVCPECHKFPSLDTDVDPEVLTEGVDDEGTITAEVRITCNCAECNTELKEAYFNLEDNSLEPAVAEHKKTCSEEQMQLSMENLQFSRTDRTQTKGKNGKLLSPRYSKRYYGIEGTAEVSCACGHKFDGVNLSDEIQSSAMDELV